MFCYECALQGVRREAIGMCHNCSLALCREHAHVEPAPVVATYAIRTYPSVRGAVELPVKARKLLCAVCRAALGQRLEASMSGKPTAERAAQRATPPGLDHTA